MARPVVTVDPWETFRAEWREIERLYGLGRSADIRPVLEELVVRLDGMGEGNHPLVASTQKLIDEMGDPDRLRLRLRDVRGKLVQAIGEWEARRHEEERGFLVEDYRDRRLGYDYISRNPQDEEDYRKIEVKGKGHGGGNEARPTRKQWEEWRRDRHHYWFYPVADCLTNPRVRLIPPDRLEWRSVPFQWLLPRPKRPRARTLARPVKRHPQRRRTLGMGGGRIG